MPAGPTAVDVLVAGAGPVGLSLAIELGRCGVSCLAVERNDRVGYSPRAKTTNVRTREHLRRWGIADALRQASPIPPDYPPTVVFATRMNGPELARFENAFNGKRERNELYSEEAQWVPQYTLEEVLRRHATSLPGVDIQFGCELVDLEQDGAGVTATVRDLKTGAAETVPCAYLVGADGARSFVREAMGARMQGASTVFKNYSIIFRAPDLPRRQVHGDAIMYWLVNADVPALLGPMDQHGLWFFMATKLPDNVDPATGDPVELIRRGTGLHDLGIEVVRTDPWSAYSLIADRYADRRMFLAGNACHLHPDGKAPPPEHPSDYVPSAVPGCLAPHAWLADGSSLYDHFGPGYTLLVTDGHNTGAEALAQAAAARGMPLTVVAPGDERLPGAYAARFALIRPDQHVAWRGDALPDDVGPLLDRVAGRA